MPTTLQTVTISFPEIRLHPSAGHKLRGFFGNLFRERSPLLHNHYETGGHRYAYPLVQYKVVGGVPTLLGLAGGAGLLTELFLQMDRLELEGRPYPIRQKNIKSGRYAVGASEQLYDYRFGTLWMALNQKNYDSYRHADGQAQAAMLKRILTGNMLSFLKGIGYREENQILATVRATPSTTGFKDQKMLAFGGTFTTNLLLPPMVGLGKSVSRGFGAVLPMGGAGHRLSRPSINIYPTFHP